MAEQAAGRAVGRVHRAQEAPGLRQQFAHGRRAQLREVRAAVDRAEVRDVPARGRQGFYGWNVGFETLTRSRAQLRKARAAVDRAEVRGVPAWAAVGL